MATDVQTILKLRVPVIVEVGRLSLPVSEVLNWIPGAIIEVPKKAEEPLTLHVNNKPVGTGSAVKVAENFGIRIESLKSPAERVKALGEAADAAEAGPESPASEPADAAA